MIEKTKNNLGKIVGYIIIYLVFFSLGLIGGMILQQAIIQATLMKVADNLDGVQIEINLNESKLIEGITDFYEPYLAELKQEYMKK